MNFHGFLNLSLIRYKTAEVGLTRLARYVEYKRYGNQSHLPIKRQMNF